MPKFAAELERPGFEAAIIKCLMVRKLGYELEWLLALGNCAFPLSFEPCRFQSRVNRDEKSADLCGFRTRRRPMVNARKMLADEPDRELLNAYAREHSEDAFARIVRRHAGLVHGVAVRVLRDDGLAQDVGQEVFVRLAKRAPGIDGAALPAWLHKTAYRAAVDVVRSESRRRRREERSVSDGGGCDVRAHCAGSDVPEHWDDATGHLDAALLRLGASDRRALLARFYENKSFREVGRAIGKSENAARMQVSRALEKVSGFLSHRGVCIPAVALASGMSAEFSRAAQAHVLAAYSAVAGTAVSASQSGSLISGLLGVTIAAKTAVATALAAVAVGSGYYWLRHLEQGDEPSATTAALADGGHRKSQDHGLHYDWESRIETNLTAGNINALIRTLHAWSQIDPERALSYFIANFCQPSLSEARQSSQIDLYETLKILAEQANGLNERKCFSILSLSNDPDVRSALVWGLSSRLLDDGNTEVAKTFFGNLDEQDQANASNNFFVVLTQSDPVEAAGFLESLGLSDAESLGAIMQSWALSDWKAALDWARGYLGMLPDLACLRRMSQSVAGKGETADIEAFFQEIGEENASALKAGIAELRMTRDLEQGASWAVANLSEPDLDNVLSVALLRKIDEHDLVLGLSRHLTEDARVKIHFELGKALARKIDPLDALQWLDVNEAITEENAIFNGILSSWVSKDAQAAFDFVNELESPKLQDSVVVTMAQSVVNAGAVDDAFLAWIESSNLGDKAFAQVVSSMCASYPHMAAKMITRSPNKVADIVFRSVASNMAAKNPREAATWASTLSGPVRAWSVADAVATWASRDADAAYQWIRSDLDKTLFDSVVWGAVANIDSASPATKQLYVDLIADENRREMAARMLKLIE